MTYTKDNYKYTTVSRWIKLENRIITSRHSLYDYGETEDAENIKSVWCFRHNGKLYALNQFMRLSYPVMLEDADGKTIVIGGYDSTQWYKPYLLEIHPDGEYIRLWNEEYTEV